MIKYIAFLRAVNVGGRVVKMDELKNIFAIPGLKNISTYIQSGNVLFESMETNKDYLIKKIETKLLKSLGYEVKVLLKSASDMVAVVKNNPFKVSDENNIYITFLSSIPDKGLYKPFVEMETGNEIFEFLNTEIYIKLKKNTYGETKFSNNFFEKKLKLHG